MDSTNAHVNNVPVRLELNEEELVPTISKLRPINRLPRDAIRTLIAATIVENYGANLVVVEQGEHTEFAHYLLEGAVSLLQDGDDVDTIRAGTKVGLRALDHKGRSLQTIKTASPSTIAKIPRHKLDEFLLQFAPVEIAQELEVSEISTAETSDWMVQLLQSRLFSNLPATNIQTIFKAMESVEVDADEVVIKQGEVGEHYYIVIKGYCDVTRTVKPNNHEVSLNDLGPGDSFGEEALITGAGRNATVTMLSAGQLIKLRASEFKSLILEPMVTRVDTDAAQKLIADGAQWIDIREPQDFAVGNIPGSLNIDINMIRLHANKLDPDTTYVICGGDPLRNSVGTFLLAERGFKTFCLNAELSELIDLPEQAPSSQSSEVVPFPNQRRVARDDGEAERAPRVAREASGEPSEPVKDTAVEDADDSVAEGGGAMDDYAQTMTGKALAGLIQELNESSDPVAAPEGAACDAMDPVALDQGAVTDTEDGSAIAGDQSRAGAKSVRTAAETAGAPMGSVQLNTGQLAEIGTEEVVAELHAALPDVVGDIHRDYEQRIADAVKNLITERVSQLESMYREKFDNYKNNIELLVRRREQQIAQAYKQKQQLLQKNGEKLIALADKIRQQKLELQVARAAFDKERCEHV